jgi:ABC-2 type transport system permease protein
MERFKTLMLREWLQHRLGWTLLAVIPLLLGLLVASFGSIQVEDDFTALGDRSALLLTLIVTVVGAGMLFVVFVLTALLLMSNLARRDHGDRANEFWHSLPVGHVQALTAPLLVHLLLVPAAGLLLGLVGGWLTSGIAVTRLVGLGAWVALPWGDLLPALLAVCARLLAGLPLAMLWLLPLLLAVILAQAWLRRWGLVALVAGGALVGTVLEQAFGQPVLRQLLGALLSGAGRSLTFGVQAEMKTSADVDFALSQVAGWAWADLQAALAALASPWFAAAVLLSALLFLALLDWRRRFGAAQ